MYKKYATTYGKLMQVILIIVLIRPLFRTLEQEESGEPHIIPCSALTNFSPSKDLISQNKGLWKQGLCRVFKWKYDLLTVLTFLQDHLNKQLFFIGDML